MKAFFDRYFFGEVAAVRPYLLIKGVLLVLAVDTWVLRTEHGGRYGVGGFNVAHFGWLDAIQPVPTTAFYVGFVLFCGLLAFVLAMVRTNRVGLTVFLVLYTYSWAMSMLDSYQHHYFLSLVLFCMVFFPSVSGTDLFGRPAGAEPPKNARKRKRKKRADKRAAERSLVRRVSAWGYVLSCASTGIVYLFTSISKTELDWRTGHALDRLTTRSGAMKPFEHYFARLGMGHDAFFSFVGHSVILLQVVIFLGYLAAPLRDEAKNPWLRRLLWIPAIGALSFHVGAEYLDLRIGWFSYYMMLIALVVYLPESWLWPVARLLSWPSRAAAAAWGSGGTDGAEHDERFAVIVLAVATAGVAVLVGHLVDMPGALAAGIAAGAAILAGTAFTVTEKKASLARPWIAATGLALLTMWVSIASTEVRYNFYRFVGGDSRRRGDLSAALDAYVKADRYAPEGKSRKREVEELRRALGQGP